MWWFPSPTIHRGTRRWMKMLDWMSPDCESLEGKPRRQKVIFTFSPSVWMTHTCLSPSLIGPLQSDSTIIAEMRLWSGRHTIEWHLKIWAFQIDYKVDKRPCDRWSASYWVTLTFPFFLQSPLNCVCSYNTTKVSCFPTPPPLTDT